MADQAPYLQRNPGPVPVDVPAIPATVPPGESVLWPSPIAGLEPVRPATAAPAAAVKNSKRAIAPTEEGDQR